jgi:alpha-amylase/alpha-mannosidase (GH57 family)
MDRYICIHGHFYQPPRENPWLEAIELQDSAYPFHDWNARITAECYAPNAASRILDAQGRIVKIVNNYARMSFNFGPTLLAWLETESPETYRAILEADQESQRTFSGHGAAIAQAYNHMILPLANRRDKYTQVRWGIRDFERRFGRSPEAMWLPETAVDMETLEILVEHGIRFTILAPAQAKGIRKIGEENWEVVSGGRIDPTRAYLCNLPSGRSISLFFYDGPVSQAIAFEKLLDQGDRVVQRLTEGFSDQRGWPQLVHIATDGETYGHHHRFGDMALAYALDSIHSNHQARLTIYGEYLEKHPPEQEVRIEERTAWSCTHGLDRWAADCGCHTGGEESWNQSWRAPLRSALEWLQETLAPLYEQNASELLRDPWAARDDYINVILNHSEESILRFFDAHTPRPLTGDETVRALKLLELQRHAMLMFTSCGWFFSELSGIETVQVIAYAGRAVQLAEDLSAFPVEEPFLERLAQAKSNLPQHADGRVIYQKFVKPAMVDLLRVGAHYTVSSLFNQYPVSSRVYCYQVDREDYSQLEAGRPKAAIGRAHVTSVITRESAELTFGVIYLGDLNLTGGVRQFRGEEAYRKLARELIEPFNRGDYPAVIRLLDSELGTLSFSIKSLFRDEQRKILSAIWNDTLEEAEGISRQLYDRYVPLMRFHTELGIPLPKTLRLAAEFALNMHLRRTLEKRELPVRQIDAILHEARESHVEFDPDTVSYALIETINSMVQHLSEKPQSLPLLKKINGTLEIVSRLPFSVDLWTAQNVYYRMVQDTMPQFQQQAAQGNEEAREWLQQFRALGDKLAVRES